MGRVIGQEAEQEDGQSAHGHADGLALALRQDTRLAVEDPDAVDVAEDADEQRQDAEHHEELQAHRHQDPALLGGEVLVADVLGDAGIGQQVLGHEDDAAMGGAEKPGEGAGANGVAWLAELPVGDGEGYGQEAVHTDGGQQKDACVDGGKEDEGGEWAEEVRKVPMQALAGLIHLQREEEEEEEVGRGQVEQQDVRRGGIVAGLSAEGVERQDVGWQADQEGKDVRGQEDFDVNEFWHNELGELQQEGQARIKYVSICYIYVYIHMDPFSCVTQPVRLIFSWKVQCGSLTIFPCGANY